MHKHNKAVENRSYHLYFSNGIVQATFWEVSLPKATVTALWRISTRQKEHTEVSGASRDKDTFYWATNSKIINENSFQLTKALPCLLPSMHPFFGAALLGPKVVASSRRSAHKECMEGMGTRMPLALARSTVYQPSTGHPPIQSALFIQIEDLNNSFLGSIHRTVTGKQPPWYKASLGKEHSAKRAA